MCGSTFDPPHFGTFVAPILGHLLPPIPGYLLPLILGHLLSIHKKGKYINNFTNHPPNILQEALDKATDNHKLPPKPAPGPVRGPLGSTLPTPMNIGQKFLALLDLELMKVINRNNVKASYSTMPNMEHNAKMWKNKK